MRRVQRGRRRQTFSFEPRGGPFRAAATSRGWVALVVGMSMLVLAAGVGTVVWQLRRSAEAHARAEAARTVQAYVAAWERSDWASMRRLASSPPREFVSTYRHMDEELHVERLVVKPGPVSVDGSTGQASFAADVAVGGLGDWKYEGRLRLAKVAGRWLVRWSTAAIDPSLRPGEELRRTRTWPRRAPILDRNGKRLTIIGDVVTVGIEPGRVKSRAGVKDALRRYAGVDPKTVDSVLDRPGGKPNEFLPVIPLRRSRYEQVKPQLYPVPGLVFQAGRQRILLDEGFAQQVLGRVHPATADDLKELGSPYEPGDVVGAYGFERAFEEQLAGRPSGSVKVVRGSAVVRTLARFPGASPKPVRTTLDVATQRAAQAAMATVQKPAALVALDVASGDIRAVVS